MKIFSKLQHILSIITVLFSMVHFSVQASLDCRVDLGYGLIAGESRLRVVIPGEGTVIQMNKPDHLFVNGVWVKLDEEQKLLLGEYLAGLNNLIPKMVILAIEGVDLASDTIESVYAGLVGNDADSLERLSKAMRRVKDRVKRKYRHASDHYIIAPGTVETVDDFVDKEIEAELGRAIKTSVGGILSAIAGINESSFDFDDERISQIAKQLSSFDGDIGVTSDSLKNKAQWFCDKLSQLDEKEELLRAQIPQLKPYDIIEISR